MSLAPATKIDDLPVMDELDAPDFGVDLSWLTDDLFTRDYQGLMRAPWGDAVAYRNADVAALAAHPLVSHQTPEEEIGFRPRGVGASTFSMRPPDHTALKKLTTRALTPKSVARFRGDYARIVRSVIDEALARDEIDFMRDFVKPSLVGFWGIALGMSPDEVDRVIRFAGEHMLSFRIAPDEEQINAANHAGEEYMELVASLVRRAQHSGEYPLLADLPSQYSGLDDRLRSESPEALFAAGIQDGFHTVVPMLASCLFALIQARIQPATQRDAISFAPRAFDEAARLHGAVIFTQRQATEDFVYDGVSIPRDAYISMMWLFCNRDPQVFDEPLEFRLDRPNRAKQFAFGGGPYICTGRNLAKALGEVILSELVDCSVTIESVGDAEWIPRSMLHEVKTFPVAIRRQ
jgi:cytochrome P450